MNCAVCHNATSAVTLARFAGVCRRCHNRGVAPRIFIARPAGSYVPSIVADTAGDTYQRTGNPAAWDYYDNLVSTRRRALID